MSGLYCISRIRGGGGDPINLEVHGGVNVIFTIGGFVKCKVEQAHLYWFVMTLATYAVKCGISKEELEADAYALILRLNAEGELLLKMT